MPLMAELVCPKIESDIWKRDISCQVGQCAICIDGHFLHLCLEDWEIEDFIKEIKSTFFVKTKKIL